MPHPTRRAFLAGSLGAIAAAGFQSPMAFGRGGLEVAVGAFLDDVRNGRLEHVRMALRQYPQLASATDREHRTAFALAYLNHHREVGEAILSAGYEPDLHESALALDWQRVDRLAERDPEKINAAHPIGGTVMVAAALGGAGSDIWHVYGQAGDPNVRPMGSERPSALRAAMEFHDLRTAEMTAASLLANGAEPNPAESDGISPLHIAAARGSAEIVEMLVRKGADVGALDQHGRTALELARQKKRDGVAALLEDHVSIPRDHSTSRRAYDVHGKPYHAPDIDSIDIRTRSLVVGASHFKFDDVKAAIAKDARLVHSVATTTEGAVEACAHTGQSAIVEFLLERGAPYSLLTATMLGDAARVRELLAEDPQRIHERGPHDFALLWYPILGEQSTDLLQLLVDAGAEIERQHHLGTTALHFAAGAGMVEHAEWLIEHGAYVNRIGRKFDAAGQTPLQLARARQRTDVEKLLLARGAVDLGA